MPKQFVRFTHIVEIEIDNLEELQSVSQAIEESFNCIDNLCDLVIRTIDNKIELVGGNNNG